MDSRASRGFTLTELVAVLAIVGILTGLAMPALGNALARQHLRATVDALADSLQAARTAAVRQHRVVDVCPSRNGRQCAGNGNWATGWIARGALDGHVLDASAPPDNRIRATVSQYRPVVRFQPTGISGGRNQRITLCLHRQPATAHTLVISNAGRVRREPAMPDEAEACAAAAAEKR